MRNIIIFMVFVQLNLTGCATILKGYEDSVRLVGSPDSIQVMTKEGMEIPVSSVKTGQIFYRDEKGNKRSSYREIVKEIQLRSNKEHTLILKHKDKEKIITIYPMIGAGWFILDMLLAGIPAFYDAYTGNWCYFSDIDATF